MLKDRRNCFGQNDKASRKGIRFRKRWLNRCYRKSEHQALRSADVDAMEQDLLGIKRKQWRKMPDIPLGRVIQGNRASDLKWRFCQESARNPDLLDGLQAFLLAQGVQGGQLSATMKCAREMVFDFSSSDGKLDSGAAFGIAEFLRHHRQR
ncbi:hypothetical protein [Terrimicrobium sacchariphilum]|uniref:hypothetical protein n=1 Tax=Terrimicrobium sacchariphilum TaxID=690879 RepID=UPI000946340F|nr:hypothetical protein [Terrimicrobium sacchariphilum]